mmetsp:Transcript_30777/g.91461  ORF Transcript_30777/g.91461 Transcript_30777/m.91461 type:complete len:265 (-) Transcript_30777:315-1109(-)
MVYLQVFNPFVNVLEHMLATGARAIHPAVNSATGDLFRRPVVRSLPDIELPAAPPRQSRSLPDLGRRRRRLVVLCGDPVEQLLDLIGLEAVQELGQREKLPAVEVARAKDLLKLVVELRTPVPQVHDLHCFLQADEPAAILVVHDELDDVKEAARLVACLVVSPPCVHCLELKPRHASVAVVIDLPNHVLGLATHRLVAERLEQLVKLLRVDASVAVLVDRPKCALQLVLFVLASVALPRLLAGHGGGLCPVASGGVELGRVWP